MSKPIFITGSPRSGKTIIAGALQTCGVGCGVSSKMLENIQIGNRICSRILHEAGQDPDGYIVRLSPTTYFHPIPEFKQQIDEVREVEGFDDGFWFFKSAKILLMWQQFLYAYPEAKFIIIRRRRADIIASCMKTNYMQAYQDERGWGYMVDAYLEKIEELKNSTADWMEIWPEEMASGNYQPMYELYRWLKVPWNTKVLTYVDPKFWKVRK